MQEILNLSYDDDDENNTPVKKYVYAPQNVYKIDQFLKWAEMEDEKYLCELTRVYYKLQLHYVCSIKANKDFLADNLPVLQSVWNRILEGRTPEGYEKLRMEKYEKDEAKKVKKEKKSVQKRGKSITIDQEDTAPQYANRDYLHMTCLL